MNPKKSPNRPSSSSSLTPPSHHSPHQSAGPKLNELGVRDTLHRVAASLKRGLSSANTISDFGTMSIANPLASVPASRSASRPVSPSNTMDKYFYKSSLALSFEASEGSPNSSTVALSNNELLFKSAIDLFKDLNSKSNVATAVAAVQALCRVIKDSKSTTIMSLHSDLIWMSQKLQSLYPMNISLTSGCELFLRYVAKVPADGDNFQNVKEFLIDRGQLFADSTKGQRDEILEVANIFLQDDTTILTHGHSRVILHILKQASKNKNFNVICTESRPEFSGNLTATELAEFKIPVTIIPDCAVGYVMERVDYVLVGAEAVTESGGIVNKCGTFPVALVAKAFQKPFYVAAETFKFSHLFPLRQTDGPWNKFSFIRPFPTLYVNINEKNNKLSNDTYGNFKTIGSTKDPNCTYSKISVSPLVSTLNPSSDYTPPEYITLLFTDQGVLTPAAAGEMVLSF